MKLFITILLLYSLAINAQITKDTLYIELKENIKIDEYVDNLNHNRIKISFMIRSKKEDANSRVTTYNFEVDNLTKDFKEAKFDELEDIIKTELKKNQSKSIEDLSELSDCFFFLNWLILKIFS